MGDVGLLSQLVETSLSHVDQERFELTQVRSSVAVYALKLSFQETRLICLSLTQACLKCSVSVLDKQITLSPSAN